jgi:hypothetical protein
VYKRPCFAAAILALVAAPALAQPALKDDMQQV